MLEDSWAWLKELLLSSWTSMVDCMHLQSIVSTIPRVW